MVKNLKRIGWNFHVDVNKLYAEAPECTFNGERVVMRIELHCWKQQQQQQQQQQQKKTNQ